MEGPDLLRDALAAGASVVECFVEPSRQDLVPTGLTPTLVDRRAMERLAGTKNPQGPVAVIEIPTEWLDRDSHLLVSVGVSDPGNVGTMIRTAAAFGWGFAYMEGTADPWSPKTIRAGAGGQFQTAVSRIGSLAELGEWCIVATVVRGGESFDTVVDRPVALLIGEEANGLEQWAVEAAARAVTITTPGPTESLNAAVAAAIAIHELSKRSGQSAGDV